MSITLAVGATVLTLSPDLLWGDELDWHPVEQSMERTLTGALILSVAEQLAGRPITLAPEDDLSAWMRRGAVEQLQAWAAVPGQVLLLTLRGVERAVVFRHQDTGLEAVPVVHYSDVDASDFYRVTLRFMEI